MRLLIYIFGLLSLSSLSSAKDKSKNESGNVADKEFLRRYKLILQLYDHINQLSFHKEISETANKFDLEQFLNDFKKPDVAEKFRLVHEGGHLSRNAIFSEFHNEHIAEAKALFFLFYFSNTLETFFEAACWARQNLNGRLFLYSLGAALTHREDCKNFSIPPIYERDGKLVDIINEEGLDILGNMIEGNADSPNSRYFGSILHHARHLLGYANHPKHKDMLLPSAMEHSETALRDPAFYQMYKYICSFFLNYKQYLPPYTKQDLQFPGVVVKKVEFEKLVTFFDYFYSDLSNAVEVSPEDAEDGFKVRVKQYRLNQKPFKYRILVDSDEKDQVASVRVFIGPKYDEEGKIIDMDENRINFVALDYFPYILKKGENIIERNSGELFEYCDERKPYRETYQDVLDAEARKKEFRIRPDEICFPRRVALPKGSLEGTPYQFFIMISPYKSSMSSYDHTHQYPVNKMDDYPMGYPLDRPVENNEYSPNAALHEALVYFEDVNYQSPPHQITEL